MVTSFPINNIILLFFKNMMVNIIISVPITIVTAVSEARVTARMLVPVI